MNKQTNATKLTERILGNKSEVIKMGLDVHARDVVLCVQEDSSLAQRPQGTNREQVIALVRGLVKAGLKAQFSMTLVEMEVGRCTRTVLRSELEVVSP
jgi:hypothetical protein